VRYGAAVRRLLVLLAAIALLAGCGGGGSNTKSSGPSGPPLTKKAYLTKVQQIAKDITTKFGKSTSDIDKLTDKELNQGVKEIREFADELQKVSPPAEIADLHRRLIGAFRDLADELPGLVQKMKGIKDQGDAFAVLLGAKAVQESARLQQEFKKKGYALRLNGS
jgi:hypothetical protein